MLLPDHAMQQRVNGLIINSRETEWKHAIVPVAWNIRIIIIVIISREVTYIYIYIYIYIDNIYIYIYDAYIISSLCPS